MTTIDITYAHIAAPAGTATHPQPEDADLRSAALSYWSATGWPVRAVPGAVVLSLGDDLAGLVVSQHTGADLLAILNAWQVHGPALSYPGPCSSTVLLTHRDELLDYDHTTWQHLLPRVSVLGECFELALPPTVLPTGSVRWTTPTDPANIEPFPATALHKAATVLAQLTTPQPTHATLR